MKYDVIVCGAGPSGIGAAVSAARTGAKVLLVERYSSAGGMATTGLVNPWAGHEYCDPQTDQIKHLIGGVFAEVLERMGKQRACRAPLSAAAFDEERLKIVYDQMLSEAGVTVRFHTQLVSARCEQKRLAAIETVTKGGHALLEAEQFIDTTGDGDLAAMSGCSFTVGRREDGLPQAMTLSFRMAGVDKTPLQQTGNIRAARAMVEPYFHDARASGRLEYPYRDFVHFYDYPRPGVLHFNMTRVTGTIGLSAEDLTRAEIEGRRQSFTLADWLVREVPWFRNAWLEKLAFHIGVRETRHVEGLYTFSAEDVTSGRKFDDGIARSAYFIDIHSPIGSGFVHEVDGSKGSVKTTYAPPPGDWYEIPYRSIIPKGIDNLLVPCRAFSATHEGAAAARVMATMTAVGQAAGLAAAEACRRRVATAEVPGASLRDKLRYLDAPPAPYP